MIVLAKTPVLVHAVISSAETSQTAPPVLQRGSGMVTPLWQPVPKLSTLLTLTFVSCGTRHPHRLLLLAGLRVLEFMLTSVTFSTTIAATDGLLLA
jgi:hypothetical protein